MTWLARCLVRDWTSCFFTTRLTLDDHALASSPHVAVRNLAFDKRNDKSFHSIHNNNVSRPSKKCNNNNNRQLNSPIVKDKDRVAVGNRFGYSSWSFSADEDYIVLCFGKDGAFDVVKDEKYVKSEDLITSLDGMNKNSRPSNCKVKYGEDAELNIHEKKSNANQHNTDEEDEEKEMVYTGRDSMRRACQVEGIEEFGKVSVESRDSFQSEGSTGSFAFPVLGWEWIGSPAQMPKSEELHLKKQKTRSVPFQCCRFL